jgi:hypothetical protein
MEKQELKQWPIIVGIISLIITLFPVAYGIYTLNRIIITAVAIYYAYWINENKKEKGFYFWALVFIAILFNPIIPIYLGVKFIWGFIDLVIIGFFIALISKFKK